MTTDRPQGPEPHRRAAGIGHPDPGGGTERLLVALRKAAVLAHWVPGLGLRVSQPGRPTIRVARWTAPESFAGVAVEPCEFRRMVCQLMVADDVGLASLIGLEANNTVRVGYFSGPDTEIGGHGLIRFRFGDDVSMFAFPTVAVEPASLDDSPSGTCVEMPGGSGRPADRVRVAFDHDPDLDTTLVHAGFPVGDAEREQQTFATVVDLAARLGTAEVIAALAPIAGRESRR